MKWSKFRNKNYFPSTNKYFGTTVLKSRIKYVYKTLDSVKFKRN